MFGFFARKVASNTTVAVASAGIANVTYTAGTSAYDFTSKKYKELQNSSSLFGGPLPQVEREESMQIMSHLFNY